MPRDSALLVIDPQESFRVSPVWARRHNPHYETNTLRLVEAFRAAGRPVVYFLDGDDDEASPFHPRSPHYRLMDFVRPRADEPVLHKMGRNAFTGTDLGRLLTRRGVGRVVVTGIKTEQCCETTARVASDLGYEVDYVTEATLTFPILDAEGRVRLDTPDLVARTEAVLDRRFARVCTVEDVLHDLAAAEAATA